MQYRHLYGDASCKCTRFRMVPGEIVIVRGIMLDGRFNGNDDIERAWSSFALRLGHHTLSTSARHNRGLFGHDVEFYILGTAQ